MGKTAPESILDLVALSTTLPHKHFEEIQRDGPLRTIDTLFSAGHTSVVVTGTSASGKTTVLRQFVERNNKDAINLFIDPRSNYIGTYELAIGELVRQLYFLRTNTLIDRKSIGPSMIREILPDVATERRIKKQPIVFVIDGLFDLEPKNPTLVNEILSLIPAQLNCVHFLFSASDSNLRDCQKYWPKVQPYAIPPVTSIEARQLLKSEAADDGAFEALFDATGGHIGQLASIARLRERGVTVEEILDAKPTELRSYYELEWEKVGERSDPEYLAIASIVFLPEKFAVTDIAAMCGLDSGDLLDLFSAINFIKTCSDSSDIPTIESYPFRRFLEGHLSTKRDSVIDSALMHMRNQRNDDETIDVIPALLNLKGDAKGLSEYLTPEIIDIKLRKSQSILAVAEMLRHGLDAAKEVSGPIDQLFYALQSSTLIGLINNPALLRQVAYFTAMSDYQQALVFARSIFSIEGRVLALSKVASEMARAGKDVDNDLLGEIGGYITSISDHVPEERALDIATELVGCSQKLAVDFLSRVAERSGEGNAFDWLITGLAQRTLERQDTDAYEQVYSSLAEDASDSVKTRLGVIRDLFRTSQDSRQLIGQIRSLESIEQKSFLGRAYLKSNAHPAGKVQLAVILLEEMIADSDYSPNATTYSDLTDPLLDVDPKNADASKLYQLVHAQTANIHKTGPTPDYYQVQINLASYAASAGYVNADEVLFDVLESIEKERLDPDVELTCLVRVGGAVSRLGSHCNLGQELTDLVEWKTDKCIDVVIESLADQDSAIEPAAYTCFCGRTEKLFEIHERLNTQGRRDSLLRLCMERYGREFSPESLSVEGVSYLSRALAKIENERAKSAAYVSLGRAICQSLRNEGDLWLGGADWDRDSIGGKLIPFMISETEIVSNPYEAALHAADILHSCEKAGVLIEQDGRDRLVRVIQYSVPVSEALDGTKSILVDLVKYPSDAVSTFVTEQIDDEMSASIFRTNALSECYKLLMNLVVRAASHLIDTQRAQYEDILNEIDSLVRGVGSLFDRCMVWAHLAGLVLSRRQDVATAIVQEYLFPTYYSLRECEGKTGTVSVDTLVHIAPVAWKTQRSLLNGELSHASTNDKDRVYLEITRHITRGINPGEPEPPEGFCRSLKYDDLLSCVEVIEGMTTDSCIWAAIQYVLECDRQHDVIRHLKPKQADHVISTLDRIVQERLPAPEGVSHDGYKVLIQIAVSARLRRKSWSLEQVRELVDPIGNVSDCAYMYSELVGLLPRKQEKTRRGCLDKAIERIESIPSAAERLGRARVLIRQSCSDFPEVTQKKVDEWFRASLKDDSRKVLASQKQLIDSAYRLDPEWGASLASVGDEGAVSAKTKSILDRARERREKEEEVKEGKWQYAPREDVDEYANVYWRALGRINARGYSSIQNTDLSHVLEVASRYEIQSVFPAFAFYCNSMMNRVPADKKSATALECFVMLKKIVTTVKSAVDGPITRKMNVEAGGIDRGGQSYKFVASGGRGEAIEFIRNWLHENGCEELIIVDPYFELTDFDVIRFAQEVNFEVEVTVVGGGALVKRHLQGEHLMKEFNVAWKDRFDGEEPPEVTLFVPYLAQEKTSPIHDRWLITDRGGLQLGTSLNGFGSRDSSISILGEGELASVRERMTEYLHRTVKNKGGASVKYLSLPLA